MICITTLCLLLTIGKFLTSTAKEFIYPPVIIMPTASPSSHALEINQTQIPSKPRKLTDIEKYNITNFQLCDIAYKSHLLFGSHHKTGSMLLLHLIGHKGIVHLLRKKCEENKAYHSHYRHDPWYSPNWFQPKYHLTAAKIHYFMADSGKKVWRNQRRFPKDTQDYHYVILNIIRNPIDTILSAYNYHRNGQEQWNIIAISNITTIEAAYDNAASFYCSKNTLMRLMRERLKDEDWRRFGDGVDINNITLQQLYSFSDLNVGIAFEYERYSYCCFDEIYGSYHEIERLMMNETYMEHKKYNESLMHLYNFRTEDFVQDYNGTVGILLDKIGIIWEKERIDFIDRFQEYDVHNPKAYTMKQKKKRHHITDGKFNKTLQREILLRDKERCAMLKKQTEMLDYNWTFKQFC